MKHIIKALEQTLKQNYYSYKELERCYKEAIEEKQELTKKVEQNYYSYKELERYHREEVKKNNELTEEVKRLKKDLFELSKEYTNGRKTKTT